MNYLSTPSVDNSSGCLTPEIFHKAIRSMIADMNKPPEPMTICCHPLDEPFYSALFSLPYLVSVDDVLCLWNECKRKYFMGQKRGISKWSMSELLIQYRKKLGQEYREGKSITVIKSKPEISALTSE